MVAKGRLAGLSVGIVREGQLAYTGAFGVRDLETREPVMERSLFHLAAVSKPFVATALVQLVERGAVALDAPVIDYLPYFRLADERSSLLTIRQVLSHVSGMPDTDDYGWERPEHDEGALERYVRSLSGEQLIGDPGGQVGLSWFIDQHAGRRRISHDGRDDGFSSYCAIFPDQDAGVVWMTSRDSADEATLIPAACDAALGIG